MRQRRGRFDGKRSRRDRRCNRRRHDRSDGSRERYGGRESAGQRATERLRRLKAGRRVFLNRHQNDVAQRAWDAGDDFDGSHWRLLQVRRHDLKIAVAEERAAVRLPSRTW